MSYEGYVQVICDNGHYSERDALFRRAVCNCGAADAWQNDVDQTNCDSWGYIPVEILEEKFLLEAEKFAVCDLGHKHVLTSAVFNIPSTDETNRLRTRRLQDTNERALIASAGKHF
jgi:hypothetical protein